MAAKDGISMPPGELPPEPLASTLREYKEVC